MMRLHLNKPGIRVLGAAESFKQGQKESVLAGVVMRRDLVIDGLSVRAISIGGDDATRSLLALFKSFGRNDINLFMVSGAILSLYNIVDVDELARRSRLPVVCLTFRETSGIEDSIRRHFPDRADEKLKAYRKLGVRKRVKLESGHVVYARASGMDLTEVKAILDMFTLQGSVPEPVRVARLLARATLLRRSSRPG
jgi:endonuclease V-like protein UPF0215 family